MTPLEGSQPRGPYSEQMCVEPFLHDLLHQALDRATSKTTASHVRVAMARLTAHLLREFDGDLDEPTTASVVDAIRQSLDDDAVVIVLGRALWLMARDEKRLFASYHLLADAAFREGRSGALAELVSLLCLMGCDQPVLPEAWGSAAVAHGTQGGVTPAVVRMVTRWVLAFDHVPPWLRALIDQRPAVLKRLTNESVLRIQERWPSAALGSELARRAAAQTRLDDGDAPHG
jgi:hypothetical protein